MYISKIVFLTFTIFFSTLSFGADFRDLNLKIGGINLGDDLSQHLSSYQIEQGKKGTEDWYSHLKEPKKFTTVRVQNHPSINQKYRKVTFDVLEKEEKFIIHGISFWELKKMSVCKRDMDKMTKKLSQKFPNLEVNGPIIKKHSADTSGKSIQRHTYIRDKNGNEINIVCTDWSNEITKTKYWGDSFKFIVNTIVFSRWTSDYR